MEDKSEANLGPRLGFSPPILCTRANNAHCISTLDLERDRGILRKTINQRITVSIQKINEPTLDGKG